MLGQGYISQSEYETAPDMYMTGIQETDFSRRVRLHRILISSMS